MKAAGLYDCGGPEVLEVIELPEPHAGRGEVRVRVRAAAVNPTDMLLRSGWRRGRWGADPPYVPGMDVAGVLDEIGDGVARSHGWKVGDEVVALVVPSGSSGGYSECVVVPAASVTRKPANTTFPEAASFLMNSVTARLTLDLLALAPGETLGVTGGAGAFGGYVIQLAARDGLRVVADSADADEDLIRSFGASDIVRRGAGISDRFLAVAPNGLDAIADGALLHDELCPAIRDGGQIAVLRLWDGEVGRGIKVHPLSIRAYATNTKVITDMAKQVERGLLAIRIADTYPLAEAADAHRRLERGGLRGRLVLTVD